MNNHENHDLNLQANKPGWRQAPHIKFEHQGMCGIVLICFPMLPGPSACFLLFAHRFLVLWIHRSPV